MTIAENYREPRMDIKNGLINALDRVFADKNINGFWDDSENRIIERLYHDGEWNWKYRPDRKFRYSLFCLGLLLLSKEIYGLNTDKYDDRIKKFLFTIKQNENNFSESDLTYGALLSLILGAKIYNLGLVTKRTEYLLLESLNRLLITRDNQDFLLLIAVKYYYDFRSSLEIAELVKKIQNRIINSLNNSYNFGTGDIRAPYHQRIMYTLWGLIFTASISHNENIKPVAVEIIDYFFKKRRSEDNAFLWHPALYFVDYRGIKVPIYNKKSSKYLFECHQTFLRKLYKFLYILF